MIRFLIPVFLLAIVAITVLVIHKRESKGAMAERLEKQIAVKQKEIDQRDNLLAEIDRAAHAEYTVNEHNTFAWNVTDKIKELN